MHGLTVKPREQCDSCSVYLPDSYAQWFKLGIVTGLVVILYGKVLFEMAQDWWNEPQLSQGMLLPPFALCIAWFDRGRILRFSSKSDRRGLLLIAFACLVFLLGKLGSEFFLMRISFVVLIAGLIWTFWGTDRLRVLAFPLLLLATMVPLPVLVYNSLAGPLQLFASDVASQIVQSLGVSVFRDGNVIQLAHVSLGVEEACSGLSALSAIVVGSLLLGYLFCSRFFTRFMLLLMALPVALAVNVIRVAGTAVLADYNQKLAMGFYHTLSGWLVFVAGFSVLYSFARILHRFIDQR